MKVLRGIAYGMVLLCAVLSIAILAYKGNENSKAQAIRAEAEKKTVEANAIIANEGEEIGYDDLLNAASVIVSGVSMEIKEALEEASAGNNSGEIDYEEIVRLQTEEVEEMFKEVISDYNKANGISSSSTPSSVKAAEELKESKDYVVNKKTGIIHKTGCLLAPLEDNAKYFSTLKDAKAAGYTDKCTVCSP